MRSYHPAETTTLFQKNKSEIDNLWMKLHYFRIQDHNSTGSKDRDYPLAPMTPTKKLQSIMGQVLKQRAKALWERNQSTHHVLVIEADLQASALPGLGAGHVTENSLSLHPLYGVPYFPSSSIKGLVRHWVMQAFAKEESSSEPPNKQTKLILPDQIQTIVKELFGGEPGEEPFVRGKVQFDDAFFTQDFSIEPDVLTVHVPDYYAPKTKRKPPTDDQSPNPVSFYAVKGGSVRFTLSIPKQGCEEQTTNQDLLELAGAWLQKAIQELGLGAKTTSGYGWFSNPRDCTHEVLSLIAEEESKVRAKQEQERARRKAEQMRLLEQERLAAMTPCERLLEEIGKLSNSEPDVEMSKGSTVYQKIWELPEIDDQRQVALALKGYWERVGQWKKKDITKKQLEKVQQLQQLIE